MTDINISNRFRKSALALACGTLISLPATAGVIDLDDDISLEWNATFTYGASWRVQGPQDDLRLPDPGLLQSDPSAGTGTLDTLSNVIDNAFILNGNDGNNNFETGLVSQRASFLGELDFQVGDGGLFVRFKGWHDQVYHDGAATLDYKSYNPNPKFGDNGGDTALPGQFTQATGDYMGGKIRHLDMFVYNSFDIGERTLTMRLGRQVISWGEALMSGGGVVTATNHVDAQIRNVPGLEIKEIFMPNGAIYGQMDLTDTINMEAYYQYEWQPTIIDPSGSYFSEFDTFGAQGGGTFAFLTGHEEQVFGLDTRDEDVKALIPSKECDLEGLDSENCILPNSHATRSHNILVTHERRTITPDDDGQWGVAFRYLLDSGDELGFYYVRYHAKIPNFILPLHKVDAVAPLLEDLVNADSLEAGCEREQTTDGCTWVPFQGIADLTYELGKDPLVLLLNTFNAVLPTGLDYDIKYFDNIDQYALSYSTVIGSSNVAAELVYNYDHPLMRGDINRFPDRENWFQLAVNALHIFQPNWMWDAAVLTAEFVSWNVPGRKEFNGTVEPDRLAVQNTPSGWGYSFLLSMDYKNVIQGIDLVVPIYVNHGVEGAMLQSGYRNGQVQVAVGVTAKYLGSMEVGVGYSAFFGDKSDVFQRLISDRDNVSAFFKYTF